MLLIRRFIATKPVHGIQRRQLCPPLLLGLVSLGTLATGAAQAAEPSTVTLSTVGVVAQRPGEALKAHQRATPGSTTTVSTAALQERSVSNTADALRYVPGVMANSNSGGDDQVISIRGSNLSALDYDNSGVELYRDGLPVTAADGSNHNRLVDPMTTSNIMVANGANALTYGASTLGGAINYVSRTARNSLARQLFIGAGRDDHYHTQASVGGINGNLDGLLSVSGQHFTGYRQHSRLKRYSVHGNAGWRLSDAVKLRVYASHIDSQQQLAGALTQAQYHDDASQAAPSYLKGNHQVNVKTDRLAVIGHWTIDNRSRLEFGVSNEYQTLYHPIVTSPYFSLLIDTHQNTTGGMVRYHLKAGDHQWLAGVNLSTTTNSGSHYANNAGHRGTRNDAINQKSTSGTLFLLDHWKFAPSWTLIYGTQGLVSRRDVRDHHLADNSHRHQQHTYSSLNPRAGLLYAISRHHTLFANISRLYEAPNNFDLDNEVHQDDTTLDAMKGVQYEVGTRGEQQLGTERGRWNWSLAAYYARINNEILSTGQPGQMHAKNYNHTIHAGIEALLGDHYNLQTAGQLTPKLSISINHFRFDDDASYGNNWLPSAPSYSLHGEFIYHYLPTGFYLGPTVDWVGARYADMANSYKVGGHALLGFRVGIKRDSWEAFVEGRNLTNRKYVSGVSVQTQATADAAMLKPGAPLLVNAGLRLYY